MRKNVFELILSGLLNFGSIIIKTEKINISILRKSRIENLKTMINKKEYVDEAISKLANSLSSGLLK